MPGGYYKETKNHFKFKVLMMNQILEFMWGGGEEWVPYISE
jgi:hypothetical protein